MTSEERARRREIERRKRRKKVKILRTIIKIAIYAILAVLVFLLVKFAIIPLFSGGDDNNAQAQEATAFAEVETAVDDTAIRKTMSNPDAGEYGWNCDDTGGWWYKNPDGTQFSNGWKTIDGQRYYFLENGYLATGWQSVDGQDIYFDQNGMVDSEAHLKLVALTFDDGPSNNTPQLLDTLEKYNAKATFFVVGTQINDFSDVLIREHELGMEIGNHTYDHTILNSASAETIQDVLTRNDDLIESLIGERTSIVRPTGGGVNSTVINTIDAPLILWDVDTLDWETGDSAQTVENALAGVQDGSIILMHDLYKSTADACETLVPALQAQGYKLVTVSEMAEAYGYTLSPHMAYYDLYPDGNAYILGPEHWSE